MAPKVPAEDEERTALPVEASMMKPLTGPAGVAGPIWIRCTLVEGHELIHVNMAYAATFVARNGGSRIWIAEERRAIDVIETPAEIVQAMTQAAPQRGTSEPHPFAYPLARH